MTSKTNFLKVIKNTVISYEKMYPKTSKNMRNLLLLDSHSGMIKGYKQFKGSQQQIVEKDGKLIFDSDSMKLTNEKLYEIFTECVDYKSLDIGESTYRVEGTRTDNVGGQTYFDFKDLNKAKENAEYMTTIHYKNVIIKKEKIDDNLNVIGWELIKKY
jgi:hypothetical protein